MKIDLNLDPVMLDNILEICNLRGNSHLSLTVLQGNVIIGAISPEYLQVLHTGVKLEDVQDISIRIPTRTIKPILSVGLIRFDIDQFLIMSRFYNGVVQSRVKIPLELDFNAGLIGEVVEANKQHANDDKISLAPLMQLRDLASISKQGVQVEDKLAYISSEGYVVYKPVTFDQKFIVSKECLGAILGFVRQTSQLIMFDVRGYHAVSRGFMIFCWRKTRQYVNTDYDTFNSFIPQYSMSVNFINVKQIVKTIAPSKTQTYTAKFEFQNKYLQIGVGAHETFVATFSRDYLQDPEESDSLTVEIPYSVLRTILLSNSFDWSNLIVSVYETCVAFQSNGITVVMIRGD